MEIEKAKKWIEERILFINQYCDLKDTDSKEALDSLQTALICIKQVEQNGLK